MTDIALLGTGLLGSAFVEAALGRGDKVTVWNRTASKATALKPLGAVVAASPADAVFGAERVHLVLSDDEAVDDVIAALRSGLSPETIIVDHTTTEPGPTAARSERLNAEGVRYLHCPVFIGPAAARVAKGTIMVSGPRELFDEVEPALLRQAERVEYLGEAPGLAAVHKLAGNAMLIGLTGVVADAMTLARGAGASADEVLRLLEYFNPLGSATGRARRMAGGDYQASFELTMARKDVRLMIAAAGGLPLSTLPGLAARMDVLIGEGLGDQDLAVVGRDAIADPAES